MATIHELTDAFLATKKPPSKSENTYKYYRGRLALLVRMFGDRQASTISPLEVQALLQAMNTNQAGQPWAPDTIRSNTVALEQWQKFAFKMKAITEPLFEDLEKPAGRLRERLPTPDEVTRLKAHCSPSFVLIYQALRICGARPNELARATVSDWHTAERAIVLTEHKTAKKTGRARKIAVGAKLQALLEQSLDGRTEGHLFVSPRGKPWTTATLSSTFRRARQRAGLDSEIVLYSARHECGTAMYKTCGELAAANALGHSSTAMLKRYAHISPDEQASNQDACDL